MDEELEVPSIPMQFAVKSMNKGGQFLQVVPSKEQPLGYLQFASEKMMSPFTKFEVERSEVDEGLVHIRCVYNNRYWVLRSQTSHFIVAGAQKTEEDQSKPSCTLFKPVFDKPNNLWRLRHVHLNRYIHVHNQELDGLKLCMFANSSDHESDSTDTLTFTDWESICILPRYVAFKGKNGLYLRPIHYIDAPDKVYLQFKASDIAEPGVRNEIFTSPTGVIRIKNVPYGKYWIHDPDWIMVKGDEKSSNTRHGLFKPIKVGDNVVALRSLGNSDICRSLTEDGKVNCLNATAGGIIEEARLEVVELVMSREIYNVNFRLSDSRIYNERPITMATTHGANHKDVDDKLTVKLSYEDTFTSTWSTTSSWKFGGKITIDAKLPIIGGSEVEISGEVEKTGAWGETEQTKTLMEVTHEVVVPKRSRLSASIVATRGTCDVPFSYTQKDKLLNGKTVIRRLHDGLFTGVNSYNFKFVADQQPI